MTSTSSSIPDDEPPYVHAACRSINFLSQVTYSYINPMLNHAQKKLNNEGKALELKDCMYVPPDEGVRAGIRTFLDLLEKQKKVDAGTSLRLWPVLYGTFKRELYIGAMFRFLSDMCMFISPIILRLIIDFLKASDAPEWKGFVWVALLVITNFAYATLMNAQLGYQARFAQGARNVLTISVYEKLLRLGTVKSTGNVMQLYSSDCGKIVETSTYLHNLWAAPVAVIAFIIQLWFYVGWAALIALGIMLVSIPIQVRLSGFVMGYRRIVSRCAAKRVQTATEALQGIRICKFMCWENTFFDRIDGRRRCEMKFITQQCGYLAFVFVFMLAIPTVVTYVVFAVALSLAKSSGFDSGDVFPALAVLNGMRGPLSFFPISLGRILDVNVSLGRIATHLSLPEYQPKIQRSLTITSPNPVEFTDMSLWYDTQTDKEVTKREILNNVSLTFPKGSLTFITGGTGQGKSSLVLGLLGEGAVKSTGFIRVEGRTAYSSQEAWIMNATVRANITLGHSFDKERYDKVVQVCQLTADLVQLPSGDLTEIGEKGVNLSGGQKQRISLARAMYSDADVYVLDDPLSAVDTHVANSLMKECFVRYLEGKTRILVTHQTQFNKCADQIVEIANKELIVRKQYSENGASPSKRTEPIDEDEIVVDVVDPSKAEKAITKQDEINKETKGSGGGGEKGRLIQKETTEVGGVKMEVYVHYVRSMSWTIATCIIVSNVFFQLSRTLSDLWIAWWPERTIHMSDNDYLLWWGITNAGSFILSYSRQDVSNTAQYVANQRLHTALIRRILHAPTSFFDTTPIGRALAVMTRDFDILDNMLPLTTQFLTMTVALVIAWIVLICVATPYVSVVVVVCSFAYYKLYAHFTISNRGLKRLDGAYRAPVLSLMSESLSGLTSIRACGLTSWVSEQHLVRLEDATRPTYCMLLCSRWLNTRLEYLGTSVVFTCSLLAIIQKITSPGDVNISVLGLAIVYTLALTQQLSMLTRFVGELEAAMNSVERVKAMTEMVPQEKTIEYDDKSGIPAPDPAWPRTGTIEFCDFSLRYRDSLPLALKNVTCTIPSGKRVGLVGRTGSGKSTILLALFRIVEAAGGCIRFDERDISTLQMYDLRSKMTVIPQDPVLFEGTVRSNLDPFHQYKDEAIMASIRKVNLHERIGSLNDAVAEKGSNFSVGQRQLLCMARALLKNCKILLMDEATASVDHVTDALIQRTIRSEFHQCTVLTIAHRLLTVMDSDLIMVMSLGNLVEFGSPKTLLSAEGGVFAGMVGAMGQTHCSLLTKVACGETTVEALYESGEVHQEDES